MHPKQLLICFFTGYLVLVLNLGDAVHRANCFGIHADGPAGSLSNRHAGCQCHAVLSSDDAEPSQSVRSNYECAFCKFFDQYNGTPNGLVWEESVVSAAAPMSPRLQMAYTACSSPVARGPPS